MTGFCDEREKVPDKKSKCDSKKTANDDTDTALAAEGEEETKSEEVEKEIPRKKKKHDRKKQMDGEMGKSCKNGQKKQDGKSDDKSQSEVTK